MTTSPRRGHLVTLFVVRGASSAAYFALLPFLGLLLVETRGLSGAQAGAVVAVTILSTRAGGVLLAAGIDRVGFRPTISGGYVLAAILLTSLTWLPGTLVGWLVAAGALGLCLAAATTAQKALVAEVFAGDHARMKGFSYLNAAVNAGSAVGPVAGGVAYHWHAGSLPILASALMCVAVLASLRLPTAGGFTMSERGSGLTPAADATTPTVRRRMLAYDRGLFVFLLLAAGSWIGYSMVFNVLAAYLAPTVSADRVGFLFTLNALIVIVCQVAVGARVGDRLSRSPHRRRTFGALCLTSNAVMGVSLVLFAVGRSGGMLAAVAAMVLFTAAEMVWATVYDAEVTVRRGRLTNSMAYATAGLAWGSVESVSAWIGLAWTASSTVDRSTGGFVFSAHSLFLCASLVVIGAGIALAVHRNGVDANVQEEMYKDGHGSVH